MPREAITSDKPSAAALPFSMAVRGGGLIYFSGPVAADPATGELIDGDVAQQTDQVLRNLATALAAADKDLGDVVRVGVYLTDMSQFAAMNEVYRRHFVRLADRELVDRAVLDKAAWEGGIAGNWSSHLYFFAAGNQGSALYARFFAPDAGVDEDPATGSACASLAASLVYQAAEQDGTYHLQIAQGVAMGRPSTLEGTAHKQDGQITEVAVGGRATIVGNGTMTLPRR